MINRLFSSQFRINIVSGTVTTAINAVVMVIAYPVYLHFLGYEKYGVWLVLATVLTFAQLGNLGIGPAVMKLVAEDYGRGDIEGIQHYVTTALGLLCISGTIMLIMILLFRGRIIAAFKLSGSDAEVVSSLVPYIGVLSIYVFVVQVFNGTLSGLGRMDLANYIQALARLVSVCVVAILLYKGFGILSLLIGNTASYIFNHSVSLFYIRRIARIRLLQTANLDAHRCKRLLHFGGGVFGGTVISMLGNPFNKLMLSRYAGVFTVPIYEIAFNGAMQIRGLIEAGFRAFMPESSRVTAEVTTRSIDRMTVLNRRAMKLIFLFGIPMYIAMFIFATPLLRIWLREGFIQSISLAFRIMLVATFISLLGVPPFYFLMGMGRVRGIFVAKCITWLTCMVLVTMIAVNTNYLSAPILSLCLIISWFLSSAYLIWLFRSAMRNYEKIVPSIEDIKSDALNRYVGSAS